MADSVPSTPRARPPAADEDREWLRRQARTVRALAAEQRRWVEGLDAEALRRFARSTRARAGSPSRRGRG